MKCTNITISLDTRREKKDGTYPLILRLGHYERTTSINLGYSVKEKDWDDVNKVVKKSYVGTETVSRLNNLIQKKKAEAMDILLKLDESGQLQHLSITDVKQRLVDKHTTLSFLEYGNKLVDDLKTAHRMGTARSYGGVLKVLKGYNNNKDLPFHQITHSFLSKFETYHRSNGNGTNGLAVYMRSIRAIFNKAIKDGIIERDLYPFADYKIKTAPTVKRALPIELLHKIIELKFEPGHICFNARNFFIASYMMYGMNFTDMAHLHKSDIIGGRIKYRRKKTGKLYDIKVTDGLQQILSYYINQNPDSPYVFPIIKRESAYGMNEDIIGARKRYNKKLKLIATECGIEQQLTSYVSRHSFATQAMMHQIPLNAISSMLGHSSLKTTEVYLKSLPSNVLDEYNLSILNAF